MKILLDKNRSVLSNNNEQNLNIELESKNKFLPGESLTDKFSLFEQYNKERDNCNNYRLIFNINSICNNILFNVKTEVLVKEGSDKCECLNFANNGWSKNEYAKNAINTTDPIYIKDAIRDTEYSNENNGNFVYHCGIDIFNNHLLRKNKFIHVNKVKADENEEKKKVYNTIGDYLRCDDGRIVNETDLGVSLATINKERHLYFSDSLDNLKNAYFKKCRHQDGWWGFINPGMINVSTSLSGSVSINNMLSDKSPCEFIDFYPDRSLFSFVPKYNPNYKRIEKNWECCITYPYKKDAELLKFINGVDNDSIKVKFKLVTNSAGIKLLQCTSYFKHNLKARDIVNLYYYLDRPFGAEPINPINDTGINENTEYNDRGIQPSYSLQLFDEEVSVYSVGDLNGNFKDRIFSIKFDVIESIYEEISNSGLFYKKVSNNCECSYYIRKYKKIKNKKGLDLKYDINKAGFGNNIYGDDVSQIIFTDDLDLNGVKDENGRDIQNVYLTFVKTNKGHDLWYKNHITSGSGIEYSHCFGKLTSGIDFAGVDVNEQPFDYNVRYLHNLDRRDYTGPYYTKEIAATFSAWGGTVYTREPKVIEDDITIDENEFYGDIVEFDNYLYQTTVIGKIYHRFNTAQRESFDVTFQNLTQDVITVDDYDAANSINGTDFTVKTYYLNSVYNPMDAEDDNATNDRTLIYSNIMPEGYFYNPHNKVEIKEETSVKHSNAKVINYAWFEIRGNYVISTYQRTSEGDVLINRKYIDDDIGNYELNSGQDKFSEEIYNNMENDTELTLRATNPNSNNDDPNTTSVYTVTELNGYTLKVKAPADYGFVKGDNVCVYDKSTHETIWGTIKSFNKMILTITFNKDAFDSDVLTKTYYFKPRHLNRKFYVFWSENNVPLYAKLCLEQNEFAWRDLKTQSELNKNDKLYDLPFANGRLYIEKNINFFLRRQDPWGDYKLSRPYNLDINVNMPHPISQYIIKGAKKLDIGRFETYLNDGIIECY